jgi:TRAP-type C4-dicarboxylate transport system permease small subunit
MSRDVGNGRRVHRHASGGDVSNIQSVATRVMGALTWGLALVGGAFLLIAAAITLVSVIGRYGFGAPVPGDYELVEITCAVGVFLFFPYTHAVDGNITADFFTAGLAKEWQRVLDIGNDVIFTLVAMLLTWRLAAGLVDKFNSGASTVLIGIPLWWAYSVAVLSMFLLVIVCLIRVVTEIGTFRR